MAIVAGDDICHYLPGHFTAQRVRHDAEYHREQIGGSSVVAIVDAVRVKRMAGHRRCSAVACQEAAVKGLHRL